MKRQHKLFYGSSYDRGLVHLLEAWPEIKKEVPDATLDVCYGWDLFDRAFANNPERMAWKDHVNELMEQDGITHHGRVGKKELIRIMKQCGVWAYFTDFDEILAITALPVQALGLVPVVINRAALKETVGSGIRVDGDINDMVTKKEISDKLSQVMTDEKLWEKEHKKAIKFAKDYTWENIAKQWLSYFKDAKHKSEE